MWKNHRNNQFLIVFVEIQNVIALHQVTGNIKAVIDGDKGADAIEAFEKKMKIKSSLKGGSPEKILELIHVAKLYLEVENFAIYPNALSEDMTLPNLLLRKCGLRLSLVHFNPPSRTSDILLKNGNETVQMNDYLVSRSPAY